MCAVQPASFVRVDDFLMPEEIERDPARVMLRASASAGISVPPFRCRAGTGDLRVSEMDQGRVLRAGRDRQADALRPHLARASLLAGRLRVERAEAATSALELMGPPAAVLASTGRVDGDDPHLERLAATFLWAANGGLAIADRDATGCSRRRWRRRAGA